MFNVNQTVVLTANGKELDLTGASERDYHRLMEFTAKTGVSCPICREPVRIVIDQETGQVIVEHPGGFTHELEDSYVRRVKRAVAQRLRELFPDATVALDVEIDGHIADIVAVRGNGGKLVVEYQSADSPKPLLARLEAYKRQGIVGSVLLDPRRLKVKTPKRQDHPTAAISQLEVKLMGEGHRLRYAGPRQYCEVDLSPDATRLAVEGKVRSLGRLPCRLRTYRLSQLTIIDGVWKPDTSYDPERRLPQGLPNRLAGRR